MGGRQEAIHGNKMSLCRNFDLPSSKVRVIASYIGGSFGAKGGGVIPTPVAAWLALKTGRPVKCTYTREEAFVDGMTEMPMVVYIKDGVKKDGTLVAREMKFICNGGAYCGMTVEVAKNAAFGAAGTYRVPNFKLDSYDVATNCPPAGPYRGYGSTQVVWAIESQMNMLAEKLGIDAVEMRLKNILREGDKDVTGQPTHSIGARECLEKVVQLLREKKSESIYPWKVGKGFALCNKYTMPRTASVAFAKVCDDGSIELRHSAHELGQGSHTILAQMAAEEFQIPIDKVRQVTGDTALTPYDFATVSSRTTFHLGNAVLLACQDAKRQLFKLAASRLEARPEELDTKDGVVFVKNNPGKNIKVSRLFIPGGFLLKEGEIIGKGQFSGPNYPFDTETGQSERATTYYAHGAYGVEVAVNLETGETKVTKAYGAFDMGQPINLALCEGQMEGGMGMGIGGALYEQMVMNDRGEVVNPSFTDYKMPRAADMPPLADTVSAVAFVNHREGPYGAKGFSRAPCCPWPQP